MIFVVTVSKIGGSSPLARGLRSCLPGRSPSTGIIPARAGFTGCGTAGGCDGPDHPRSRGVYSCQAFSCPDHTGSSPLARGLQLRPLLEELALGIIPARAGFTGLARCGNPSLRDHPRSRGVYASEPRSLRVTSGSSPLARGLREHLDACALKHGIIPARAGFTLFRWSSISPSAGSSPLARGLRWRPSGRHVAGGIIPARAGFTDVEVIASGQ